MISDDAQSKFDDALSKIIKECLGACNELVDLEAMFIGSWLTRTRRETSIKSYPEPTAVEVQQVKCELYLFNVAVLLHLLSDLTPLTCEMRDTFYSRFLDAFKQWAYRAFPQYLKSTLAGPQRQLEWRQAEYDCLTVRLAIEDADPEAQMRLCQQLFANTNCSPTPEHEVQTFQISVFCQDFPRFFVKVLDSIYGTIGPNSRFRNLYLLKRNHQQVAQELQQGEFEKTTTSATLATPATSFLSPRRSIYRLRSLFSALIILTASAGCSLAVFGLAGFPTILTVSSYVFALPPFFWLLTWANHHLVAARGALRILQSGRYTLYLRESTIDEHPPYIGFESALASAVSDLAPLLAIDYPKVVHPSGAVRISVGDEWQAPVAELMRNAELCILVVSPRRGYGQGFGRIDEAWKEIESVTKLSRRGRVLFFFPRSTGDFPLILLHPKGDRTYGLSTLLHEVRRFIDVKPYKFVTEHMGVHEWLWWNLDGRFVPLPETLNAFPRTLTQRIKSTIAPVFHGSGVAPRLFSLTCSLAITGTILGGILFYATATSVHDIVSHPFIVTVLAGFSLFVVLGYTRLWKKRSSWLSYKNTIRPQGIHAFGLEGVYPGRKHPKLPN